MPPTIVVLAAGTSSRFGRPKQLEPLGPDGATLTDYLLFDAHRAGISRAVLVTQPEVEGQLLANARRRVPDMEVVAVHQPAASDVPGAPAARTKPLGTGHAVLAAQPLVEGPFIVANADDFYGREALATLAAHLDDPIRAAEHAIAGYRLDATLSSFGGVSRAICATDGERLTGLEEVVGIRRTPGEGHGIEGRDVHGSPRRLTGAETVSMNLWGFRSSVFPALHSALQSFVGSLDPDDPDESEFLLSDTVGHEVRAGRARVRVLDAGSEWFGITFEQDLTDARRRVARLAGDGRYPVGRTCA
jgi:dTDP-glucose pyrophosphorylase